ncbi:unnamed protein product [Darwinula stevensoni]|uniref:TFIIS N-terminal domain-containing protein n=1 Tax=Darwinula stevensoni TaxID=69355 RepID=A0A7R8ZYH2_9CRUS|nr:unnamed protein product [Darwinula stevensoni]CAG0881501.1 unnamed protein product [Darwinula stevensoni]
MVSDMAASDMELIILCKRKLQKYVELRDEEKILSYLSKLKHLRMTVSYLQETGVGRTVNALRKEDGAIGQKAKALVTRWKELVMEEEEEEEEEADKKEPEGNARVNGELSTPHAASQSTLKVEREASYTMTGDEAICDMARGRDTPHDDDDGDTIEDDEVAMRICDDVPKEKSDERPQLPQNQVFSQKKATDSEHCKHTPVNKGIPTVNGRLKKEKSTSGSVRKDDRNKSLNGNADGKKEKKSEIGSSKDEKKKHKRKRPSEESEDKGTDGKSFAEALGMADESEKSEKLKKKKKKHHRDVEPLSEARAQKDEVSDQQNEMKSALPLIDADAIPGSSEIKNSLLPVISPDYKPQRHYNLPEKKSVQAKLLSEDEALQLAINTKNNKTKVFSGTKGSGPSSVPSLFDLCIRSLQENIDSLEFTGGVPYTVLEPVFKTASAEQLFTLEYYNPYLLSDTDPLWERLVKKDFRNTDRQELESWRDMYDRCKREREAKLQSLTSKLHHSMSVKTPSRQTKLAYVDSVAKPPRSIARQQAKYGTGGQGQQKRGTGAIPLSNLKDIGNMSNSSSSSCASSKLAASVKAPPPLGNMKKPKVAPLMQKTLRLMKSRFRR